MILFIVCVTEEALGRKEQNSAILYAPFAGLPSLLFLCVYKQNILTFLFHPLHLYIKQKASN